MSAGALDRYVLRRNQVSSIRDRQRVDKRSNRRRGAVWSAGTVFPLFVVSEPTPGNRKQPSSEPVFVHPKPTLENQMKRFGLAPETVGLFSKCQRLHRIPDGEKPAPKTVTSAQHSATIRFIAQSSRHRPTHFRSPKVMGRHFLIISASSHFGASKGLVFYVGMVEAKPVFARLFLGNRCSFRLERVDGFPAWRWPTSRLSIGKIQIGHLGSHGANRWRCVCDFVSR